MAHHTLPQLVAKALSALFFRNIYISGKPHMGKSTIWAANHTSGIVDAVVLHSVSEQSLRPLSKHTLWENPVMKVFLNWVKAIPVYRVQDIKKDVTANKIAAVTSPDEQLSSNTNNEAFQQVAEVILSGGCPLIFPEGVSHDTTKIYKLKTGLARMAIQTLYKATDPEFTLWIQPVTIDYFEKDEFRSDLAIHFCEPIALSSVDFTVHEITETLQNALNDNLATFETWEEKRNWQFIFEMIYGRKHRSAREFKLAISHYKPILDKTTGFLEKIQIMRHMLLAMRLEPRQLIWGEINDKSGHFLRKFVQESWFYLIFGLISRYTIATIWVFPFWLCHKLAESSTKDRDVVSTFKIGHGLYILPLWSFLYIGVVVTIIESFSSFDRPFLLWLIMHLWVTPLTIFALWCIEKTDFFPGFWQLAQLKILYPRRYKNVMDEWRNLNTELAISLHLPMDEVPEQDLKKSA